MYCCAPVECLLELIYFHLPTACPDGFPCRIYDKETGEINSTIAAYWREHYDMAHILQRDWASLGPKMKGKLHVFVGGGDTYFLTDSVMDLQVCG